MKSEQQLNGMGERELIDEVLVLQERLRQLTIDESAASLIHNYHFTGHKLLRLSVDKMLGSGVIFQMFSIKGKPLFEPTTIKDGLSNETINALLDDMQRSFDLSTTLKPLTKRLK